MHVSLSVRVQRERKRQREVGGGEGGGDEEMRREMLEERIPLRDGEEARGGR